MNRPPSADEQTAERREGERRRAERRDARRPPGQRVIVDDERFARWKRPGGWEIVNVAPCRGCGKLIAWARTLDRKPAPLDRDGTSHFATCPEAERFRKTRELDAKP
jgi:hypothetical protein